MYKQLEPERGTKVDAMQVSAGWDYNCAVLVDGKLDCWGLNINGQVEHPVWLGGLDNGRIESHQLVVRDIRINFVNKIINYSYNPIRKVGYNVYRKSLNIIK